MVLIATHSSVRVFLKKIKFACQKWVGTQRDRANKSQGLNPLTPPKHSGGGGGLPDDRAWSKTILESEHSWLNLGVSIQNRVKNTKGRMLGYAELAKTQGNTQTIYTRK